MVTSFPTNSAAEQHRTRWAGLRWHRLVGAALALVVAVAACGGSGSGSGDTAGMCRASPDQSVANIWNNVALEAIRRDTPDPTVHARNLFHLSAAMWDVWAGLDDTASPVFDGGPTPPGGAIDEVRVDAMHHAAATVLSSRYRNAEGRTDTLAEIDDTLATWCDGDERSPAAAWGAAVADAILDTAFDDGANERLDYQDFTYQPVNPPMDPSVPGADMVDPNRWQPLSLTTAIAQNGLPLPAGPQQFLGAHWGAVTPFSLPSSAAGLPLDPGPPPYLGGEDDDVFRRSVVEVIRAGAELETGLATIDLSPGARGDNPLGTDDGEGHPQNPIDNAPYEPNVVDAGDYGRVIAEYWADGPDSETPPGHWNVIANEVSDHLAAVDALRLEGVGDPVDRLEWDVKLYLALNGAAHDAAVAAWGAKAHYDYVRPISMIRHAGGLGQSSDPARASYHPDGLPLVEGLIELVTADSAGPGAPHEHLADHIDEVVVRGWRGGPDDPTTEISGVGWIRAVEWVPYQRPTFVTPSFAAYVSGHSTFSRAAAEVLAAFTGSPFFPGGLDQWTVPEGALLHEEGPSTDVTLQWATYFDAADEAGRSRIHGGIHVVADDWAGRRLGAEVGRLAYAKAAGHYG